MGHLQSLIDAYERLSEDTKEALTAFRLSPVEDDGSSFAYKLNEALRTNSMPDKWKDRVTAMNNAFQSSIIDYPITVYRAVNDVTHLGVLEKDNHWTSQSFISTSTSWHNLSTHIKTDRSGLTGAVLNMRLPAGTPAVYLGHNSSSASESELLLPPNMRFKIYSVAEGNIENYTSLPHITKDFASFKEIIMLRQ